ncbi:MAG: phosphatase PAP2 family protein [Cellulophaga sp.]
MELVDKLIAWDRSTFVYLNSLGVEQYDTFWITVTNIFTWIPLFILFFVLVFIKHPKKEAFSIALTIVALIFFILFLTDITKEFIERLRPNNEPAINGIIRILKDPSSYSFFSGHASSSFSVTTLVVLFLRKKTKWVWLFYIWPLVFVTSRIYVGVHYPVDIIVGALVGTLTANLFYTMHRKFIKPYLGLVRL